MQDKIADELPPTLFLAWQESASRRWFPIGRLRWFPSPKSRFEFVYTRGFEQAQAEMNLEPLVGFPDVHQIYVAPELFPQFRNRIMHSSREDFGAYLARLDLTDDGLRPILLREMDILARSEGRRSTDHFEVFPLPLVHSDEGRIYQADFFVHGMKYVPGAQERAFRLAKGERLLLVADWQNQHDPNAIMLRSEDNSLLGWMPRYYSSDLTYLRERSTKVEVVVERVNTAPAPIQQTLLCRVRGAWPAGTRVPLSQPEYQSIATTEAANATPRLD